MKKREMISLQKILYRARHRFVTWASTRPSIYYGLRSATGHVDKLCVRKSSDIVIEGFPRSANSTTVHKFIGMQDRPLHVAHHKHHAAQLLRAAQWDIPAVVLIRHPYDAVLSVHALAAEVLERKGVSKAIGLRFEDSLFAYVRFYEAVEPVLDHVVIGRFEAVRRDVPGLITRVNARFGTDFRTVGRGSAEPLELGWHAMPNEIRTRIKSDLERRFEDTLSGSASLRRLLSRAEAVHGRYEERDERAG